MTSTSHSYGPSCKLHVESNPFTRRASELSDTPPSIRAQFFYSSALPIDDPLSPSPPSFANATTAHSRVPPRPFSVHDNAALEEAWLVFHGYGTKVKAHRGGLLCSDKPRGQEYGKLRIDNETSRPRDIEQKNLMKITKDGISDLSIKSGIIRHGVANGISEHASPADSAPMTAHQSFPPSPTPAPNTKLTPVRPPTTDSSQPLSGAHENLSVSRSLSPSQTHLSPPDSKTLSLQVPLSDDNDRVLSDHDAFDGCEGAGQHEAGAMGRKHHSIFHKANQARRKSEKSKDRAERKRSRSRSRQRLDQEVSTIEPGPSVKDIEAKRLSSPRPLFRRLLSDNSESQSHTFHKQPGESYRHHGSGKQDKKSYVPVGVSRLHLVEMPSLQMKPIYWNPVHDICSVVRGTWFYRETMLPVESDVANRLEEGYEYMKPWNQTYIDEVNSCLEIGPEAELKIVYKLWPLEEPGASSTRPGTSKSLNVLTKSAREELTPEEKVRKNALEIAGFAENKAAGNFETKDDAYEPVRLYAKSSVIYATMKDAQILRPSLLPSVARGRKPLGPIRKGRTVGIPVTRGFDHKLWEKIHPSKKGSIAGKSRAGASASQSGSAAISKQRDTCEICMEEGNKPKVTDLVLVIHGIGQKLSERHESFHFTHAINDFRRKINGEMEVDAVQPWLRDDLGGIMVLPVNWRSTLALGDAHSHENSASENEGSLNKDYTLKDITAETIPAVRNLISDVMLDIPYYLSHHRPKMIEAVIKEANRVYRLWCENNPTFHETGRVHLIAHSLGSIMALDILSKQPTSLPKQLDLTSKKIHDNMFEFDTKNLFFCGSPAGFFLLLNRAVLSPRKGRSKPGSDAIDTEPGIAGEAGTYGCLAVDNIYNVMHTNDPIAYRVNACVDVNYANSLQPAGVPSTTSTWLQSIGYVFRAKPAIPSNVPAKFDVLPTRPNISKLPSAVEMETHNFTLEEIAEKKMYLLNDNGQIDYFLSSGGGPLEIQYLNMLSAHSSYWVLQDFVRFLVVEIGRVAGKMHAVPATRAVKKVWGSK